MSSGESKCSLVCGVAGFVASEVDMSDALRKLGDTDGRPEDKALSEAFHKFAVVIREHSQLLQQLVRHFLV